MRWCRSTACCGQPDGGRRWPCPPAARSSSGRLSSTRAGRVGQRVAQLGVVGDEPLEGEQLALERVAPCPRCSAPLTTATTPRCSRASARSRVAAQRRLDGRGHAGRGDAGSSCSPKICRDQVGLGLGGQRHVGRDAAQARLAAQHVGDPEQVVGRSAVEASPSPPSVTARPAGTQAPVWPSSSVSAASESAEAPRISVAPFLLSVGVAGSPGRRGSARRPGSAEPRRPATHPTMRPASEVASAPTSARSEVTACWRSASIWVCAWLDDARRLGLRLLAHLGDDRRALLARLLADARRLVAGVTELLLELGELGVGLGLLGLGRLQTALDGGRPVGERLLEVGDDPLLDGEEQQTEDDQRQDDLHQVRQRAGWAPPRPRG